MYYADRLTRGFLDAGTYVPFLGGATPGDKFSTYEDPTYLGFTVRFLLHPISYGEDGMGQDFMTQGLLYEDKGDNSMPYADGTQSFFRRRGEYYRAKMIEQLRAEIKSLQDNTPWVFEKITGLGELWKIDTKSNWRGKGKKLVISCSESISLRITHLLDLYRKAMWDAEYARWAAPDLQRYFAMEIVVAEVRAMQAVPGTREKASEDDPNGGLLQVLQGIPAANAAMNNVVNSQVGQFVQGLFDGKDGDAASPTPTIFNTGTYIRFVLDMCEFDPFTDSPTYLDASSSPVGEAKDIKLQINVGRIREFNTYGLLGAILTDTESSYTRGKEAAAALFVGATGETPAVVQQSINDLYAYKGLDVKKDFAAQQQERNVRRAKRKKSPLGLQNNNSLPGGGGGPTTGTPPNPLIPPSAISSALPGPLQNIVRGVAAEGAALIGSFIDDKLGRFGAQERLGNVYDLNPGSLANVLGALSNPEAAARNFISNQAASAADKKRIGTADIGSSGPGVGDVATALTQVMGNTLIDQDGVIGIATFLTTAVANEPGLTKNFLGAVDLLAQAVAGTPLENQSIGYIIEAVASGRLAGNTQAVALDGAPADTAPVERVNLQAPSILNTTLGNILLAGSDGATISGSPGRVVLSAAYSAPENPDLGKELLKGKRIRAGNISDPVQLSAPTVEGAGSDDVILTGPEITVVGDVTPPTIKLESATVLSPKLDNVGLKGAAPETKKNLGKADLT